jgi:hypothetical protein
MLQQISWIYIDTYMYDWVCINKQTQTQNTMQLSELKQATQFS